jgi:hypothetical protein
MYFDNKWSRLSWLEMKIQGFFRREIYKSSREGHFPFLLGFVRNCKIVDFKDLGPYHWQISGLR